MAKANQPANQPDINCGGYAQCPVEYLSELLEKLVDAQLSQAEKSAHLDDSAEQSKEMVTWIKSQFTNGFRSELKTHISDTVAEHHSATHEKLNEIENAVHVLRKQVSTFRSPKFWLTIGLSMLIAIVTIALTVHDLYDAYRDHAPTQLKKVNDDLAKNYEQLKANYEQSKQNNALLMDILKGAKYDGNTSTRPGQ